MSGGLKIKVNMEKDMKDKNTNLPEFELRENGPLKISGNFILKDSDGNQLETGDVIYICRCGSSEKMPFCDGTHKKVGMKR